MATGQWNVPSRPLTRGRLTLSPGFFTYAKADLPGVELVEGLNDPESRIYRALTDLNIQFSAQTNLLGGSVLGGARVDFLLPDFGIDLEYAGPQHSTTEGAGRDLLRNIGVQSLGYRIVTLYARDLPNLKRRILQLIGSTVAV